MPTDECLCRGGLSQQCYEKGRACFTILAAVNPQVALFGELEDVECGCKGPGHSFDWLSGSR